MSDNPIKQLTWENLPELDGGRAVKTFNQLLLRAAQDCEDRPGEEKPRIVTFQVELSPVLDTQTLTAEFVNITCQCAPKHPPYRARQCQAALRKGGILAFNKYSPTNVNQGSLDFDDGDDQ